MKTYKNSECSSLFITNNTNKQLLWAIQSIIFDDFSNLVLEWEYTSTNDKQVTTVI